MSPNVVNFNNSDYLFFFVSNSAILEEESIFCRNNEDVLYVKMVILFSKNIKPVSYPFSFYMTPTSAHIICIFFG